MWIVPAWCAILRLRWTPERPQARAESQSRYRTIGFTVRIWLCVRSRIAPRAHYNGGRSRGPQVPLVGRDADNHVPTVREPTHTSRMLAAAIADNRTHRIGKGRAPTPAFRLQNPRRSMRRGQYNQRVGSLLSRQPFKEPHRVAVIAMADSAARNAGRNQENQSVGWRVIPPAARMWLPQEPASRSALGPKIPVDGAAWCRLAAHNSPRRRTQRHRG
jgi:hypothetical protein